MKQEFKLVVFAVLCRVEMGRIQVMTQTRNPHFHKPDPHFGGLEETVAETVRAGEEVLKALVRGIKEETGVRDFVLKSFSKNTLVRRRVKTNRVLGIESLCWTEARLANRSLHGPAFLLNVGDNFIPSYKEGPLEEAIGFKWWGLDELTQALKDKPEGFVAYHLPALIAATRYLSKI